MASKEDFLKSVGASLRSIDEKRTALDARIRDLETAPDDAWHTQRDAFERAFREFSQAASSVQRHLG